MLIAIPCMIAALVLYSAAIWTERLRHRLTLWIVILFAVGFACDMVGTTIMRMLTQQHALSFHRVSGYIALGIMLLHLCWAIAAKVKKGDYALLFHRFSVYAWALWIAAFFSGIPK